MIVAASIAFTGIYNDYKDYRQRYTLRIDDLGNDYKHNWKKKAGYEDVEIVYDPDDFEPGEHMVLDVDNNGMDDNTGQMYVDFDPQHPSFFPELERHVYSGDNKKGAELTHTRIINAALSGDHRFGILKVDWNAAMVRSKANQPQLRDMELQADGWSDSEAEALSNKVTMDYTDPMWIKASSGFELDDIAGEIAGKTSADFDEDGRVDSWYLDGFKGKDLVSTANQYVTNIDFELPVVQGLFQNVVKFGAKAKIMEKEKKITQRVKFHPSYDPDFDPDDEIKNWKRFWTNFSDNLTDVGSQFSNIDYSLGNVVDAEWVAKQDVNAYATTEDWQVVTIYNNEMCDGYESAENVYAGYFMTTQNFGKRLSMITGVRLERTVIDYTGTDFLEKLETLTTVKAGTKYNSWLPGVHFRYVPTNKMVLRAAYSKTISRPSYRDLVPYEKVNVKNKTLNLGNPEIKPSFSHNFDLLAEYYPGSIGIISAGLYHKRIKDFRTVLNYETPWSEIVDMVPDPNDPSLADNPNLKSWKKDYDAAVDKPLLTQKPANAGDASLVGLELAYQRRLDFLPGFLRNLNLYANYTHNWLSNKDDKAEMSGTAEDIINLSLAYEVKRLSARISYNHTSAFLTQTGITKEYNVYCDAVNYLDLNVDYHLKQDKIILTASANNLLNEVQRYYQWGEQYTHSNLSNGSHFQLGVIFNLF